MHTPTQLEHALTASAPATRRNLARPVTTSHHRLTLLPDMDCMLRAIQGDTAQARERIWIETYIYRADRLGRALGRTMAKAVQRGVDVRLLYDPMGCNETDPRFFDALRGEGVDVRAYRPRAYRETLGRWWPRDHSRIIAVDGAAYTGGAAWGDEWLPTRVGGKGWHDVCTRLVGPCAQDFARAFELRWAAALETSDTVDAWATGDRFPDVELVADSPLAGNEVARRYRERIARAKRRVWIENSYFLPPGPMLRDLYEARARGVDVRIIVPGETDLPILKYAARSEYEAWLEHGLAIHEFQPSVMHSKFAVIDDDWATVGTFNLTAISLLFSNEVNLVVTDPGYVARAAALFEIDQRESRRVTRDDVRGRPLGERVTDALAHEALSALEFSRAGG